MSGLQYLKRVGQLINATNPAETWMDKKATFDFIYQGACEFVRRTQCLRSTQNITTVAPLTITGASKANPCSITSAVHGLATGDQIMIKDVVGMTEINDLRYTITKTGTNTFTLDGIDSSTYTTYSSAGTAYLLSYTLNYDFLDFYQVNPDTGRSMIRYQDGTSVYFVDQDDYDNLLYTNYDIPTSYPIKFALIPAATIITAINSSATSSTSQTGGESTLTDTAGAFLTTNVIVKPGDEIINKTSSYQGVVLAVTDATNLKTAMFDFSVAPSAYAGWTSGNTYMIVPRRRYQIILDAPLDAGGKTLVIPYLQSPVPVYSDYGFYSLPAMGDEAILFYAAWLYEWRDEDNKFGASFYTNWERLVMNSVSKFEKVTGNQIKRVKHYI